MSQTALPTPAVEATTTEKQSTWTVQRIVFLSAGVLGGIIALIFIIGLLLGFTSELEVTATRIEYIRNLLFIMIGIEGILIIGSIAVLIVQVTRLINMLKRDVQPVLTTAKETVDTAKGTVEFVGDNAVGPIIRAGGFMAGLGVVFRDVGGIRRAIRRTKQQNGQK
ncbi:MAG: hypothetical protein LCI00_03190 [Chloroflexi bacterium]|nr:hypothetical protein [Chloroflexota bacterium]MCC6892119.1 hypothetical protein [Anaerolineae bacterium]